MMNTTNEITKERIEAALKTEAFQPKFDFLEVLPTVGSTNTYAKELLKERDIECGLIVALEQTAGRGRQGKSFSSIKGNGIYMTLVAGIHKEAEECLFLTSAAAVAVARVLERSSDEQPKIKWVNDVWVGDKKVCGILTEAVSSKGREPGFVDQAVIGIGINIESDFSRMPKEVQKVAGAVQHVHAEPSEIIAGVASELLSLVPPLHDDAVLDEYRSRSMIIGRDVWWESSGIRFEGRAVDIRRDGTLVVQTKDGIEVLNSGLVSIRPVET